jgi:hypothetical protein
MLWYLRYWEVSFAVARLEASAILTWLEHLASHHDHSVKCHSSTIQKDSDISRCHLPGCQHFQRSGLRDVHDTYFSGYAQLRMKKVHEVDCWIPEELILSGTHHCKIDYEGNILLLGITAWILFTAWEVLALCLAVWIALKHFREKRQHMVGGMIMDCFSALMKSHVLYFARWADVVNIVTFFRWSFGHASSVAATCLEIGYVSPTISMVCQSFTYSCTRPWVIIFIESNFPRNSDLCWVSEDFHSRAVIRIRTTPDP